MLAWLWSSLGGAAPARRPLTSRLPPAHSRLLEKRVVNESCYATGQCGYYTALAATKPMIGIEYCDASVVLGCCCWAAAAARLMQLPRLPLLPHLPPSHPGHACVHPCACRRPRPAQLGATTQDPGCYCAKALAAGWFFMAKQHELGAAGISCAAYCQ